MPWSAAWLQRDPENDELRGRRGGDRRSGMALRERPRGRSDCAGGFTVTLADADAAAGDFSARARRARHVRLAGDARAGDRAARSYRVRERRPALAADALRRLFERAADPGERRGVGALLEADVL